MVLEPGHAGRAVLGKLAARHHRAADLSRRNREAAWSATRQPRCVPSDGATTHGRHDGRRTARTVPWSTPNAATTPSLRRKVGALSANCAAIPDRGALAQRPLDRPVRRNRPVCAPFGNPTERRSRSRSATAAPGLVWVEALRAGASTSSGSRSRAVQVSTSEVLSLPWSVAHVGADDVVVGEDVDGRPSTVYASSRPATESMPISVGGKVAPMSGPASVASANVRHPR